MNSASGTDSMVCGRPSVLGAAPPLAASGRCAVQAPKPGSARTTYVGTYARPRAGLTRRTPHRRDAGGRPLPLKDLHHRADDLLVRRGDVQDHEPGLGDALLIDLHASTDGSARPAGSPIAGRQPVRGTQATDSLDAGRAHRAVWQDWLPPAGIRCKIILGGLRDHGGRLTYARCQLLKEPRKCE